MTSLPNTSGLLNDEVFKRHLSRLRSSLSAHSHGTICEFLTTHTYIRGLRFNFDGHEYQERIIRDPSPHKVIIKSAQIGISEMSARIALAKAVLLNGFSTIYTLPAASAAQNFMKTRIDPVIDSSPYLRELVNPNVDNTSVKRFGDSYVYLKGAQVDRQAISVPADLVIMDEVDNSNQEVLTLFESRLIHSLFNPGGETIKLSTPTIPNYGIDMEYKQSRRHLNMCKCCHCNEWFYPDYHDHVRVPGFLDDLSTISKSHFAKGSFRWQEAFVACPKCGLAVDLGPKHREWVLENTEDAFVAAGYRVSPFDCPKVILPSALVKSSVDYERKQDFYNQRLGIPMEDAETSFSEEELERAIVSANPYGAANYVMGLDMGNVCWCFIAAVLPENRLVLVHSEGIPLFKVMERRKELAQQWRVRMTVVDHGPYTETVYRMQQQDINLFAGVYARSKSVDLFKVRDKEKDAEKGQEAVRQVNINRDRVFDLIMLMIRSGNINKVSDANDNTWKKHLTDQKRVREFVDDELMFVWRKTQGEDHMHHALLYTVVASRLLGVSASLSTVPLVLGKFKVTEGGPKPPLR
jgi:hypothetical protein